MAAFSKFNQFVQDCAGGIHNLCTGTSDTFKVALMVGAPGSGDTSLNTTATPCVMVGGSGSTELAAGNGYTKGGNSCTFGSGAQTNGTFKFTLNTPDPVWTGATGPMGPFRYVVLYNNSKGTADTRPVIGFWAYTSDVTLQIGETFTVDLDQTNGVLTLA